MTTPTNISSSRHWTLRATDAAGVSKILPGVTGDPNIGEVFPGGRTAEAVMSNGSFVDWMPTEEQEMSPTWGALSSTEQQDFCDFCHARGAKYGPGGTAPMLSVSPNGEHPCFVLEALEQPPKGPARTHTWSSAWLTYSPKGAMNATTVDMAFKGYGHAVS